MDTLNSTPIIAFETAEIFETWLEMNHASSTGIWLKIFNPHYAIDLDDLCQQTRW